MTFQCTACSKGYDKVWKLKRHVRESRTCYEQVHPGEAASRIPCLFAGCTYSSPRPDDVQRHLRKRHETLMVAAAPISEVIRSADSSGTGSTQVVTAATPGTQRLASGYMYTRHSQLLQSAVTTPEPNSKEKPISSPLSSSVTPSLASLSTEQDTRSETVFPSSSREAESELQRHDSHLEFSSPSTNSKRKLSKLDGVFPDSKRTCTGASTECSYDVGIVNDMGPTNMPVETIGIAAAQESTPMTQAWIPTASRMLFDTHDPNILVQPSGGRTTYSQPPVEPQPSEVISPSEAMAAHAIQTSTLEGHEVRSRNFPRQNYLKRKVAKTMRRVHTLLNRDNHTSSVAASASNVHGPGESILDCLVERLSISSYGTGVTRSANSMGSLFGRSSGPKSGSQNSAVQWSSKSTAASHIKSMHSQGMQPLVVEPTVEEEPLLSRVERAVEKFRSLAGFSEKPVSMEERQLRLQDEFRQASNDGTKHGNLQNMRLAAGDLDFEYNFRGDGDRTPLVWACSQNLHRAVTVLITEADGAIDPDCQDDSGMTALMYACREGSLTTVDALLGLPAIDLDLQNEDGHTALMVAIRNQRYAISSKLIALVESRPDYQLTARWSAFFNAQDATGFTALHWAAKMKDRHCVWTLLETGKVDVDSKAYGGITVVMQTIKNVDVGLLVFLLRRKACDPTVKNDIGQGIVEVAEAKVDSLELSISRVNRLMVGDEEDMLLLTTELSTAKSILRLCEDYTSSAA
jgi:ankyrin repeat protein